MENQLQLVNLQLARQADRLERIEGLLREALKPKKPEPWTPDELDQELRRTQLAVREERGTPEKLQNIRDLVQEGKESGLSDKKPGDIATQSLLKNPFIPKPAPIIDEHHTETPQTQHGFDTTNLDNIVGNRRSIEMPREEKPKAFTAKEAAKLSGNEQKKPSKRDIAIINGTTKKKRKSNPDDPRNQKFPVAPYNIDKDETLMDLKEIAYITEKTLGAIYTVLKFLSIPVVKKGRSSLFEKTEIINQLKHRVPQNALLVNAINKDKFKFYLTPEQAKTL